MRNWKTTLTAAGAALLSLLAALAAAPAELGDVSTILPAEYKAKIFGAAALAAFALKVINGYHQKDANPSAPPTDSRSALVPLILAALVLTGCTNPKLETPNSKPAAPHLTQAQIASAAVLITKIAADSFAESGKLDTVNRAHSAAQGLWTQSTAIATPADAQAVVNDWSGGALPIVAAAASAVMRQDNPQTKDDRAALIGAMASALSEAAFNALGKP